MKKVFLTTLILVLGLLFGQVALGSAPTPPNSPNPPTPPGVKYKVFVHYDKPKAAQPVLVDNCTETTNDQITDYGLAGWRIPAGGVNYKVNLSTAPKNVGRDTTLSAIQNAFSTWTSADSDKTFNYSGTTLAKKRLDYQNTIAWNKLSGGTIAVTYVWYYTATGQIADLDTIFNSRYPWSYTSYTTDCGGVTGTFDIANIATHEFGHWIGLNDLYSDADKDLTMYGYGEPRELKKDTLGVGDILGATTASP